MRACWRVSTEIKIRWFTEPAKRRFAALVFELKAEIKAQIYERCRCWGNT